MGYNKIIVSGDIIETYEFTKDLPPRQKRPIQERNAITKRSNSSSQNTSNDRKAPFSASMAKNFREERQKIEEMGRRQSSVRRAKLLFGRLVLSNLGRIELPLLFTITYADNQTNLRRGYKDFRTFIKTLRNQHGEYFRYIAVPEFQKRGAVHFHALVWGLPSDIFDRERGERNIAKAWGHGFVYLKKTDGDTRLSTYLAKYMGKTFTDPRLLGQKAYTCSRNFLRPVVYKGVPSVFSVIHTMGLEAPLQKKEFDTKWMGGCRYHYYKK